MNDKLIQRLKPLVTTFSAAIELKYSHGDEITIGGEIIRIFDIPALMSDENKMIQIEVDDRVGITTLMVPGVVFKGKKDERQLKTGDLVIAKGKVFKQGKCSKEEPYPTVFCWEIKTIEE